MPSQYHHGDLRSAALRRSVEVIAQFGPERLSLRSLAADLGVSHTAPRHHFGDLRGLLTAVAAEGFALLAAQMDAVRAGGGSFLDVGVAYVSFALAQPGHFRVMFAPGLLDPRDGELVAAKAAAFAQLTGPVAEMSGEGRVEDAAAAVIAGWGMAHGIASLAMTGNLDEARLRPLVSGGDVADITRRAAGLLYGSPGGRS